MNNKLSELSKPVATVDVQRGRQDGNIFAVAWSSAGHALPDGPHFTYSQEYVSALLAELEAKDKRIAELEHEKGNRGEGWRPDTDPITGRAFFMWIAHPDEGMVPTYGGTYDSYTLATRDKDGSYLVERYDHDNGHWRTDCIEDCGVQVVDDQLYTSDEDPDDLKAEISALRAKLATPIVAPDDGFDDCREMRPDSTNDFDTGYNFGLYRYEQNIRAAGFKCVGDE